jgi:hypothetical protein
MKMSGKKGMILMVAAVGLVMPGVVWAHCDTMDGPLIPEARAALVSGEVEPVLKWVMAGDETAVREAFAQAVAVRGLGGEAAALADRYFLETLVRLHRAGEGAPYTGIRDEPVEPIVAMGDGALADGSADGMISALNAHMKKVLTEKFSAAKEARAHKDDSVAAGRAYVAAYVAYMHYLEGLHDAIVAAGTHTH